MAAMLGGRTGAALGLAFCILLCFFNFGSAQTSAVCSVSLLTLQPCFGYIQTGNTSLPGTDCCTPLGVLIKANASCLCQVAPTAKQAGITVNETRAIEVVAACNQTLPADVVSCLSSIAPATSPSSPTSSTPSPPPPPVSSTNSSSPTSGTEGSYKSGLQIPLLLGLSLAVLSSQFII